MEEAQRIVDFGIVQPSSLPGEPQILVSDPDTFSIADRELALLYLGTQSGTFVFYERPKGDMTQSNLASYLQYNDEPTSQATFSLVSLTDGTIALLEQPKTLSFDGSGTVSIEWLNGEVDVSVLGPDDTFTPDVAVEVANEV